jgi:hypothetical protein
VRLKYFLYVLLFVATFLVAFWLLVVGFDIAEGQEPGYPGPYPGPYLPLVMHEWDGTPLPLPTSTPSDVPTSTPCDKCWTCNDVACYEFCLESCGCYVDDTGNWCVPCAGCEGGVRCRE